MPKPPAITVVKPQTTLSDALASTVVKSFEDVMVKHRCGKETHIHDAEIAIHEKGVVVTRIRNHDPKRSSQTSRRREKEEEPIGHHDRHILLCSPGCFKIEGRNNKGKTLHLGLIHGCGEGFDLFLECKEAEDMEEIEEALIEFQNTNGPVATPKTAAKKRAAPAARSKVAAKSKDTAKTKSPTKTKAISKSKAGAKSKPAAKTKAAAAAKPKAPAKSNRAATQSKAVAATDKASSAARPKRAAAKPAAEVKKNLKTITKKKRGTKAK